jgi:hypothetical protein
MELIMTFNETKKFYGTQIEIGLAIGLSKSSISAFKDRGGIPYGYQCDIEKLTDGKLKADRTHDPDNVFYNPELEAA